MRPETKLYCQAVCNGEWLCADVRDPEVLEAALESRDAQPFEEQWLRVRAHVDALLQAAPLDAECKDHLTGARETAFRVLFKIYGSADLAALASDDVELIAEALETGVDDDWLNSLAVEYASARFPRGPLVLRAGRLADILAPAPSGPKREGLT